VPPLLTMVSEKYGGGCCDLGMGEGGKPSGGCRRKKTTMNEGSDFDSARAPPKVSIHWGGHCSRHYFTA
jgi:hypothetical protein